MFLAKKNLRKISEKIWRYSEKNLDVAQTPSPPLIAGIYFCFRWRCDVRGSLLYSTNDASVRWVLAVPTSLELPPSSLVGRAMARYGSAALQPMCIYMFLCSDRNTLCLVCDVISFAVAASCVDSEHARRKEICLFEMHLLQ